MIMAMVIMAVVVMIVAVVIMAVVVMIMASVVVALMAMALMAVIAGVAVHMLHGEPLAEGTLAPGGTNPDQAGELLGLRHDAP